ncbi:hypothetical protein PtB15_5B158 [Puccinia triticina]|nr:hypothetical protein PtB15_5B158 [Puccinia triticina]
MSIHPDLEGVAAAQLAQASGSPQIEDRSSNSGDINPALTDEEQEEPATPLRVLPPAPPPAHVGEDAATIQQLGQYLRLPEIQIENIQRTATVSTNYQEISFCQRTNSLLSSLLGKIIGSLR